MRFGEIGIADAEGAILAHTARHAGGVFKKGRVLTAADVEALKAAGVERVFAARLGNDDVPEDEAAELIARAIAGEGAEAQLPFTGRANLHAAAAGVAIVDAGRVRALNRLDESLTLATVQPFDTVEARQMLATVKVIPFAVPRPVLDEALKLIAEKPLVSLRPFLSHRAGLVITTLPQTKPSLVEKSREAIAERLSALGSTLGEVIVCDHRTDAIAAGVERLKSSGHDPILVFGASAIVDRGDVVPAGLVAAGGKIVHLGMPVDPGNLLMLGRLDDRAVIGVPSCARSPKVNGFDWVLARVLAGIDVRPQDIMDMGAGGLLVEIPSRPTPREGKGPVVQKAPNVAAVVLAAGKGTRMGADNKLLKSFQKKPLVRHAVEAAIAAKLDPVVVVTGRDAEAVRAAVGDLPVRCAQNDRYADGQATSLSAGVAALPKEADAVVVLLGDMPLVSPAVLGRLVAAFNPVEGRAICVPVHEGRRGNPVLFARRHFAAMQEISGDEGARSLIQRHAEDVAEVPVGESSIFADVDTPEALAALEGDR
ncbi:MAG: molybdopterin-binding/glycosyltransferase family 2 protein [Hyphomicrobiales bacterium]